MAKWWCYWGVCVVLLGCGGGGGSTSRSSVIVNTPDIQGVSEQTVSSLDTLRISLQVEDLADGAQLSWSQVSGPVLSVNSVTLSRQPGDEVLLLFRAPAVSSTRNLVLRIVVSNPGGLSDETDIAITVIPALTLSGEILIPNLTQVDLDNADPTFDGGSNDTRNNSQALLNPGVSAGFLSGSSGRYFGGPNYPADPIDIYRVQMLAGQRLTLTAHSANSDAVPSLNFRLVDAQTDLTVASGVSGTRQQQIDVAADGAYYVELETAGGPLLYNLQVGDLSLSGSGFGVGSTGEFVPGEALIAYRPEATRTLSRSEQALPGYFVERFGDEGKHGLLRLQKANKSLRARSASVPENWTAKETLEAIAELKQRPDVAWVEPNYIRRRQVIESNPFYPAQWHYPLINLPAAWAVPGADGSDVIVAVLDTGALLNHPDLLGQWVDGYDFVSSTSLSLDGDGIDPDPSDPGDSVLGESSFHGTHVAGTVAALNNDEGGVGVAFASRIMPLRVLGQDGSGTDADLIQAIRYAAGLSNASGVRPSRRADVINMSLGGPGDSVSLELAVNAAVAEGVIVVAAAGNESSDEPAFPAAYPQAVSVSAVGPDENLAPYSNFGREVDVAAPGGNMLFDRTGDGRPDGVLSTWGDDSSGSIRLGYALMQGTSMATPHVAGVAALMVGLSRAAGDPLSPSEFQAYLANGDLTRDIGVTGRDTLYGYGLIDAARAVSVIGGNPLPVLSSSAASLLFSQSGSELLTLEVPAGVSQIQATVALQTGSAWLSVEDAGDPNAESYRVEVDASGLQDGLSYAGSIRFEYVASNGSSSAQRELEVPVVLSLQAAGGSLDAGVHYILLLDADTEEALLQLRAEASQGAYDFAFVDDNDGLDDLEPGEYLLVAGSDLDNDGLVCDAGEACAVYPIRNRPERIVLESAITGLSFSTGYLDTSLSSSSDSRKEVDRSETTGFSRLR